MIYEFIRAMLAPAVKCKERRHRSRYLAAFFAAHDKSDKMVSTLATCQPLVLLI
jgi:hypothetical protein